MAGICDGKVQEAMKGAFRRQRLDNRLECFLGATLTVPLARPGKQIRPRPRMLSIISERRAVICNKLQTPAESRFLCSLGLPVWFLRKPDAAS